MPYYLFFKSIYTNLIYKVFAQEESKHKLMSEVEYDDHVLRKN